MFLKEIVVKIHEIMMQLNDFSVTHYVNDYGVK